MLDIRLAPITTTAMAIKVVEAVMAVRLGWRLRLPSASWAVPPRAKASASRLPNSSATGLTSAGATRIRPSTNNSPPSPISAGLAESKAPIASTIMSTPLQKPNPAIRRSENSPREGRSASKGVMRLAARAGSSPASSVTPTPMTMEPTSRPGVMTGGPKRMFRNCCMIGVTALSAR